MHWLELPAVKWALPLPLLAIIAPIVWWFFHRTWRELDAEALALRRELDARGETDYRPIVALTLVAMILVMQEYYGRGDFFEQSIRPWIERRARQNPHGFFNPDVYGELYLRLWWGVTRIGGYLVPLLVWRRFFPRDHLADFGLRGAGFLSHAWIYAMCVVVMVPVLLLVSRQPDFANYYPMYKLAGRSYWLCIGNNDQRVGTDEVISFTRKLVAASLAAKKPADVFVVITPTLGHTIHKTAHDEAAAWLLERLK